MKTKAEIADLQCAGKKKRNHVIMIPDAGTGTKLPHKCTNLLIQSSKVCGRSSHENQKCSKQVNVATCQSKLTNSVEQ